jgi:hypothetical protein
MQIENRDGDGRRDEDGGKRLGWRIVMKMGD